MKSRGNMSKFLVCVNRRIESTTLVTEEDIGFEATCTNFNTAKAILAGMESAIREQIESNKISGGLYISCVYKITPDKSATSPMFSRKWHYSSIRPKKW